MTKVVFAVAAVLCSTAASGQPASRWYVGGSASALRVSAEEVNAGGTAAVGASIGLRLTPVFSVEFEANQGIGELSRVYSGKFVSFAGPTASREEIERLAVTLQSDSRWRPRFGWSVLAMWRSTNPGRAGVALVAGVTSTLYDTRTTLDVLDIPAGVDRTEAELHRMMPDSHGSRTRGGLTGGLLIPIAVTRHLNVAPEVRFTYGSFGDEIYTVLRTGARLTWNF
jgi:hypothetical protein